MHPYLKISIIHLAVSIILVLVILLGCASQYPITCRHKANIAIHVLGETHWTAKAYWFNENHVQAMADIDGWKYLCSNEVEIYVCDADYNREPDCIVSFSPDKNRFNR